MLDVTVAARRKDLIWLQYALLHYALRASNYWKRFCQAGGSLRLCPQAHVLFHKDVGDSMEGVHVSDFVFAFTTDRQLELLHQLGSGVLMMDVTDAPRGETDLVMMDVTDAPRGETDHMDVTDAPRGETGLVMMDVTDASRGEACHRRLGV